MDRKNIRKEMNKINISPNPKFFSKFPIDLTQRQLNKINQECAYLILKQNYIYLNSYVFELTYLNHSLQEEMTSFNIESEFLDLKKIYQKFDYENLITEGIVSSEMQGEGQEIYEGMTQNTYLFVQEKTVLVKDIENMSIFFEHQSVTANPQVKQNAFKNFPFEKVRDRVCFIFQKYQEQPCLLDSLLENLIQPIMDAIKKYLARLLKENYKEKTNNQFHSLLQIVYQLTKVRGKKYVIQYFPHEVKDLYPAIGYLVKERNDQLNWESRYVILLWMGVIALVPFNLDIIDSGVVEMETQEGEPVSEIVQLMLEIGKFYLRSLTKMREASAQFLSKLFTRPDIQKRGILEKFLEFGLKKLRESRENPLENFFACGLLYCLSNIFKRVQRKELLVLIDPVIEYLRSERQIIKDNAAKRELKMKVLTQIGLTYLKPRTISWAYKKKKQSLLTNLSKNIQKVTIQTNTGTFQAKKIGQEGQSETNQNDVDYYRDVNKANLEEVIDMLIDGLSEKETLVREKAAKGLGKISGRLSQDMVEDLLDYILALTPSPQTQHAVCLTIAEFIRRNLISPKRLEELYHFMKESLLYEKEEGGFSVGQAVRDSACYMTWSVARGYEQGGEELGISLMIAACFDREVGCRRAASAAYQELVGRVGNVPNGIQILTEADYFTLGLQKNAYLNVAIFVSSFEPYFKPFVEHLCFQKLRHWDVQVKRIAACSLSLMSPLNPQFLAKEMLPALASYLNSESQNTKLGSIIGISQILLGLKGFSQKHQLQNEMKDSVFLKSLTQNEKKLMKAGEYMQIFKQRYEKIEHVDYFSEVEKQTLKSMIRSLTISMKDGKIYKGKSGENFRIYTCRLLECFSICKVPLQQEEIACFKDFIEQNIKNSADQIISSAVKCLKPFLQEYHNKDEKFIEGIITSSRATSKAMSAYTKGYTLAISRFTKPIYQIHFDNILDTLQKSAKVCKENEDPEKRKSAILGLEALVDEIGFSSEYLREESVTRIFTILFQDMNDYTMDKRGDIGSIVREASMSSILAIIHRYSLESQPKWKIRLQLIVKSIGLFLQQLSEKIDRIRLLAGSLLQKFFDNYVHLFPIPDKDRLKGIFDQANIKKLIKESESQIDNNLETEVIRMEMKIQETIFHESDRELVYFWNLPHSVFPLVVPLLELESYSFYILKGLCTSAGGISESIIKYSLQQIGNYITYIFNGKEGLMHRLIHEIIRLMKECYREDRIIIPLYKTLDYILERNEVIEWEGIRDYDLDIFAAIERELVKTKSIMKVSASTGLLVSILSLNNPQTKSQILERILKILCSDLPKARKVLSDKLLMFLMSQDDYVVFNEDSSELLINILSENDFLDEKLDVDGLKDDIKAIMGI